MPALQQEERTWGGPPWFGKYQNIFNLVAFLLVIALGISTLVLALTSGEAGPRVSSREGRPAGSTDTGGDGRDSQLETWLYRLELGLAVSSRAVERFDEEGRGWQEETIRVLDTLRDLAFVVREFMTEEAAEPVRLEESGDGGLRESLGSPR